MTESDNMIIKYLEAESKVSTGNILEMTNQPEKKLFPKSTRSLIWYNTESIIAEKSNAEETLDFTYVYRVLENVQNPQNLLEFLKRTSTCGYIEAASPLAECVKVEGDFRGHILSRYIIWVSDDHTLNLLPKYSFYSTISVQEEFEKNLTDMLKTYPHYMNTYYQWDPEHPIKYVLYEHGVNFNLFKDYSRLLEVAIEQSVKSSNGFLSRINEFTNVNKVVDDSVSKST